MIKKIYLEIKKRLCLEIQNKNNLA